MLYLQYKLNHFKFEVWFINDHNIGYGYEYAGIDDKIKIR